MHKTKKKKKIMLFVNEQENTNANTLIITKKQNVKLELSNKHRKIIKNYFDDLV